VERKTNPNLCMGISRLFGSIVFLIVSIWVFSYFNGVWKLGVEELIDIKDAGAAGYGALAIAIVAGLIGLLIGQGIGTSVKISSDDLATHITVGWHYLANTSIYWVLASSVAASLVLGDSAEYFFQRNANEFFITGLVLSAIGSQVIVWGNFIGVQMMKRGNPFGVFIIKVFPIITGVMMAVLHLGAFGINPVIGIAAGFILPFIIIPMCAKMWRKDMLLRDPHMRF